MPNTSIASKGSLALHAYFSISLSFSCLVFSFLLPTVFMSLAYCFSFSCLLFSFLLYTIFLSLAYCFPFSCLLFSFFLPTVFLSLAYCFPFSCPLFSFLLPIIFLPLAKCFSYIRLGSLIHLFSWWEPIHFFCLFLVVFMSDLITPGAHDTLSVCLPSLFTIFSIFLSKATLLPPVSSAFCFWMTSIHIHTEVRATHNCSVNRYV